MRQKRIRAQRLIAAAIGILAFVASVVSILAAQDSGRATSQRSDFRVAPYLQNTSPGAVTIMWETNRATASEVTYRRIGKEPERELTVTDDAKVKIHRVRITGLAPDSRYAYGVRSGQEVRGGDFAAAPAKERPIHFAIFGDSRFWGDYWQTSPLPEHLLSKKPEFVLHMGDLVTDGRQYRQWQAHFERFESVLKQVPLFPARGNHERDPSQEPQNDWFGKYHELPGGEPYSSFDWGNSHFAIVSFTHVGKCASFLDADLGATKKKWKFVAFHYPVYCTGYESPSDGRKVAGNPELEAIFDKHRVDMVFVGHTHIYERTFPIRGGKRDDRNGTVYLVQGGAVGGNYPDWWTATLPRDFSLPHYTFLEVQDDRIELRSYGLAKGDQKKGKAAEIVEIDHCVRWRDENLPRRILSELPRSDGAQLLQTIEELGATGYAPAAESLVRYLNHNDAAVRRAAALALERIANPGVSEKLALFLQDEDMVVRRRAARALEEAMLPSLADKIMREILNPQQDSRVRICLLGALLHHAPRLAFPVAMKAIEASDGAVRDRAADVVKRTATEKDLPVLAELVRNEKRPYVAACLARAVKRLNEQRDQR